MKLLRTIYARELRAAHIGNARSIAPVQQQWGNASYESGAGLMLVMCRLDSALVTI